MLPRMKVRTEIGEEVTEQQPHQARLAIEIGEQPTPRSKIVLPVLAQQVCGVAKHDIMEAHPSRENRERAQGSASDKIGRAHDRTPVTNAHLVCSHMLEKKKTSQ